jgi:hypothetical protein
MDGMTIDSPIGLTIDMAISDQIVGFRRGAGMSDKAVSAVLLL